MRRVIILRVLIVLMVVMITGCNVKEAYLFNQVVHPPDLSLDQKQEMQTREIERQETEAKECLQQQCRTEYSGTGIPFLVLKF